MAKVKIFSFFSGSGFLDLGFESERFEIAFVNENNPTFLKAYKYSRNKLDAPSPLFGYSSLDIRKFLEDPRQVARLSKHVSDGREDGSLIGFIGGPPCPDFSMGGQHKGFAGENGQLTRVYFDLILAQKPDWFLFENVKGLFYTKKHRAFFDTLMTDLKNAGYGVNYEIINALEFGVPQYRDRVILVGVKKELVRQDFCRQRSKTTKHYSQYTELKSLNLCHHAKYSLAKVLGHRWPQTSKFRERNIKKPQNIPLKLTVGYWLKKNKVEKHPNAANYFQPTKGNRKFSQIKEGYESGKSYKRLHRW